MKKLIFASLGVLGLVACGGQQDVTPNIAQMNTGAKRQMIAQAPVGMSGERRSYEFGFLAPRSLSGKSRVTGLVDFTVVDHQVRLQDISLTFDKDGPAGDLYRLYQAAFGRVPDVQGFGYWKSVVDTGVFSLDQVATSFLASAESTAIYGTGDHSAFVARLYQNVLGRSAGAAEVEYWASALRNGYPRATVLREFAKSPENMTRTAAAINLGMAFAEPGIAYIPVSNATGPSDVPVGVAFEADGRSSTDANGDKLTYAWSVASKPATAPAARISDLTLDKPRVTFDAPGSYTLALWVKDPISTSYSASLLTVTAHSIVADTGVYICRVIDPSLAKTYYSRGHTYLDRDKDGIPCTALDIAYETRPPVASIADYGVYKCASLTSAMAFQLYLQGHTYLDRDNDGKPCEASDITRETATVVVTPPPVVGPRMCWVNGYRRSNGTYVSGYYRRC
ncbi:MAG: DUF4214 domain-containing protein [Pseudomonadota bacterium]